MSNYGVRLAGGSTVGRGLQADRLANRAVAQLRTKLVRHRRHLPAPPQPWSVVYGTPTASAADYAKPGGLVIAGRDNYSLSWFRQVASGGGTVLVYIDPVIDVTTGRYHQKLLGTSEFGAAPGRWKDANGNDVLANDRGTTGDASDDWYLANFKAGGPMHAAVGTGTGYSWVDPTWTQLEAVLELMVRENPHMHGFFADDVGSRSYFPNNFWDAWTSAQPAQQQAYRDGAIEIVKTMRRVCDRRGKILIVNGTWGAGTLAQYGGGFPEMGRMGLSLAEGGVWEHHAIDAYGVSYVGGEQWAQESSIGGERFMLVNVDTTAELNAWLADAQVQGGLAYIARQLSSEYNAGVAPYSTTAAHPTGLPTGIAAAANTGGPPAVRSSQYTWVSSETTAWEADLPPGTQAGDVLWVQVQVSGTAGTPFDISAYPDGTTSGRYVTSFDDNGDGQPEADGDPVARMFAVVVPTNVPSRLAFTLSAAKAGHVNILALTGVDKTTPVRTFASTNVSSNPPNQIAIGGGPAAQASDLVIRGALMNGSAVISPAASPAPLATVGSPDGQFPASITVAEQLLQASGSPSSTTMTYGGSGTYGSGYTATLVSAPVAVEQQSGAVALGGSGQLARAGTPRPVGAAALSGSGSLSAVGTVVAVRSLPMSGSGSLSAAGTPAITGVYTAGPEVRRNFATDPSAEAMSGYTGWAAATSEFISYRFLYPPRSRDRAVYNCVDYLGSSPTPGVSLATPDVAAYISALGRYTSGRVPIFSSVWGLALTTSVYASAEGTYANLVGEVIIDFVDSQGAAIGSPVVGAAVALDGANPTDRRRLVTTATIPSGAAGMGVYARTRTADGAPAQSSVGSYFDDCLIELASSAGPYFDGTERTSAAGIYGWAGTKDQSESIQYVAVPEVNLGLTGSGTLSTAAVVSVSRSGALSGSGQLVGDFLRTASLPLSGSGTLAAAGRPAPVSTLALSGSGTLTEAGTGVTVAGSAALTGSGTLSAAGSPRTAGSLSLTGAGNLVETGTAVSSSGAVALAGSGTLSGVGAPAVAGALALSGSGSLVEVGAAVSAAGSLPLTGSGTLTTAGRPAVAGTLALTGSGTLTEAGTGVTVSGTAVLTGSGTLVAQGSAPAVANTVVLTGSGTLAEVGTGVTASGARALTGSGTLAAAAVAGARGAVALTGSGQLSYAGSPAIVTSTAPGVLQRTNLAYNPGFEYSANAGWTSNNGAVWQNGVSTTVRRSGTKARTMRRVAGSTVSPTHLASAYGMGNVNANRGVLPAGLDGQQVTLSWWVHVNEPDYRARARLDFYDSLTTGSAIAIVIGTFRATLLDDFALVTVTATVPVGAVGWYGSAEVLTSDGRAATETAVATFDETMLELGATAGPYFDGDTPNTPQTTYTWTGTPHASTTQQAALITAPEVQLTGDGQLSSTALPGSSGTTSLTGSGDLAETGAPGGRGSLALTGSGDLVEAGTGASSRGAVALTGSGQLSGAVTALTVAGTAALAGSGALAAVGRPAVAGTASLAGSGALVAAGAPSAAGTAALTGDGMLVAAGVGQSGGVVGLTGSGSLASVGSGVSASATTTLTGSGTLAGSGAPAARGTLPLTGTGTLAVAGRPLTSGALSLSGTGTLTGAGSPTVARTVGLTGSGTLTSAAAVTTAGTGTLTGSGQLDAAPSVVVAGTLPLDGTGQLAATGQVISTATLPLDGSGQLATVASAPALRATLALTGSGTLARAGRPSVAGAVALTGSGTLAGVGRPSPVAALALTGSGTLGRSGTPAHVVALVLAGTGTLDATGTPAIVRTVVVGAELGRNLHPNPDPANTAYWSVAGTGSTASVFTDEQGNWARQTFSQSGGPNNWGINWGINAAATPGLPYSATVNVRPSRSQRMGIYLQFLDSTNTNIGNHLVTAFVQADRVARLTVENRVAPTNAVTVRVLTYSLLGSDGVAWQPGDTLDAQKLMLTQSVKGQEYFSGDTPDTPSIDYAWAGNPNASQSIATSQVTTPELLLTGSGTLAATGSLDAFAALPLTGDGSLTAPTGVPTPTVALPLAGSGSLAATGTPAVRGTVALTGSGTLARAAAPAVRGTATLTGSGQLAAAFAAAVSRDLFLTGTGTLGSVSAVATAGALQRDGSGQLVTSGRIIVVRSLATSGSGQLAATGRPTPKAALLLAGSGVLAGVGVPGFRYDFTGSGTLVARRTSTRRRGASGRVVDGSDRGRNTTGQARGRVVGRVVRGRQD